MQAKNYIHLFDDFYCTIDNLNCTVFRQMLSKENNTYMSLLGYHSIRNLGSFLSRWTTEDEFNDIQGTTELATYIQMYSDKMDKVLLALANKVSKI